MPFIRPGIDLGTIINVDSGSPFILFTDFTSGPVSGGENNKGCYLSIYGVNLGTFANYGSTNFVTIGGVNVDNYRCLVDTPNAKLNALGVKCLRVQVGALTGLSAGTAYPVSVTVGGLSPSNSTSGGNYLDPFGEAITFTPQPGSIVFIATTGNDGNAGTFASPKLNPQNSSGGGVFAIHSGANTTDGMKPGTHVVFRGGTYTGSGLNSRWVDLFRITGRPATGATDRGSICVTSYPGDAGANSNEVAIWQGASGAGGGFNGNDSTRAVETSTSYGGFTGWCQYMEFSWLKIAVNAGSGADCGPFNTQNHGQYWRIIGCEMTWPSTVSTASQARSAGIEGSPFNGRFYGNYIHDIRGAGAEANTNHGVYMDGFSSGSNNVAIGNIFAFNYITDITYGNGIQFFDGVNGAGMRNNTVAYNWIANTNRFGINIADNTESITCYNNVLVNCGSGAFRLNTSGTIAVNGIKIINNTIYGWGTVEATRYAITTDSVLGGAGHARFENNIACQSSGHAANSYAFDGTTTNITLNDNLWYDPDGRLTVKPSGDSAGAYGNPLFTNAATNDFTLQAGSPAIDTGTTPTGITRSYGFALNTAPVNTVHDRGAYERP